MTMALRGAGEVQMPAAGATGRRRTLWLLDRAAAAKLPAELLGRFRDNPQTAASYGIRVVLTRLLAFGISGFIAALAGFIYLFSFPTPSPAPPASDFITDTSVLLLGLRSLWGVSPRGWVR